MTTIPLETPILEGPILQSEPLEEEATQLLKTAIAGWFYDAEVDSIIFHPNYYAEVGSVYAPTNAATPILGTTAGDIFTIDNLSNILAVGYDEGDIFNVSNSTGALRGGWGGDAFLLTNFSGTVDLGNDQDSDVVLVMDLKDNQRITIRNFNPELDTLVLFNDAYSDQVIV